MADRPAADSRAGERQHPGWPTTKRRRFSPLDPATVGFVVAWLALACYALAYLISH